VSDEDLRALERKAGASPDDRRARHAFVAALERAGERRRAFLELCKLVRAGDENAEVRVHGWTPSPGLRDAGSVDRCPLRQRPGTVRRGPFEVALPRRHFPPMLPAGQRGGMGRQARVIAASDRSVFLLSARRYAESERLVRLDTDALAVTWQRELMPSIAAGVGQAPVGLVGDDLLLNEDGMLRIREGASGTVIAEARVGERAALGIVGDGVVLISEDAPSIMAVALGERFGETLWAGSFPGDLGYYEASGHAYLIGSFVVLPTNDELILRAEDGAPTLPDLLRVVDRGEEPELNSIRGVDRDGILVQRGSHLSQAEALALVDRRTAVTLWRADVDGPSSLCLGSRRVVIDRLSPGRPRVRGAETTLGLDRASGTVVWTHHRPTSWAFVDRRVIVGDVVYVGRLVLDRRWRIEIDALDEATGRELWKFEHDTGYDHIDDFTGYIFELIPFDGRLLVLVGQEGTPSLALSLEA
jgi:hypothetical protein